MSAFNGAGTFVISGVGLPYITGTTISSTVANQLNADLATGLSTCLTKDGQSTPIANIPLGGFKLTGIGVATTLGDALSFGRAATVTDLTVTGNETVAGNLSVTGNETVTGSLTVTGALNATNVVGANKIINGDFRIDQRNGGAAINFTNPAAVMYGVDRWIAFSSGLTTQTLTGQQITSTLAGCLKAYRITVGGAGAAPAAATYALLAYKVEGFNCQDLFWGTAQAKPITISFRAKASVAGNYGFAIRNNAQDRNYIASIALAAGVDTAVSFTVPGDTGGTWATDSTIGLYMDFDLGVGTTYSTAAGAWVAGGPFFGLTGGTKLINTAGATLEIGNVKCEVGNATTPFVSDDYEVSLAKCQRYYVQYDYTQFVFVHATGMCINATTAYVSLAFPVQMRGLAPAFSQTGGWNVQNDGVANGCTPTLQAARDKGAVLLLTTGGGMTAGQACILQQSSAGGGALKFDAEL